MFKKFLSMLFCIMLIFSIMPTIPVSAINVGEYTIYIGEQMTISAAHALTGADIMGGSTMWYTDDVSVDIVRTDSWSREAVIKGVYPTGNYPVRVMYDFTEIKPSGFYYNGTLTWKVYVKCPHYLFKAGVVTKQPTASEEGRIRYDCAQYRCDYSKVETIPALGHKDFTGLEFADAAFDYDGTEKEITVNSLPEGASVTYTSDTADENKATDAGVYKIKATVSAPDYNDWVKEATLTIKPKNLSVSDVSAKDKTYDGTKKAEILTGDLNGIVGDDEVSIASVTGEFEQMDIGNDIPVEVTDIVLGGKDKDNYTLTKPTGLKANITKAPVSVKAKDVTITQGTAIPALTYIITSGQLFGTDEITGAPATTATGTKLGTFDITKGTLAVGANYDLTFTKGTLTVVDKIPQNISVSEITEKTYGDSFFVVTVTPDATSQLTAFTFESSDTDVAEIAADGTVTIKAAGETDITVKQAGNDEYAAFEKSQKLVVNQKAITVTSVNADEKTAVLEGVLAEDAAVVLDYGKLNIEVTEAASDTTSNVTLTNFVLTGEKAANYRVTTENVAAVISNENIVTVTITADNGTVTGAGKYIKGSDVTASATPNSGYKFSGWYVNDTSVSTETTYTFTADADTELVAKFARRSSGGGGGGSLYHTVKFDTDGGSAVSSQRVKRGNTVKAPDAPVKEGYDFGGWYTDKELTAEYDFEAKVTKSMTLYAKWTETDKTRSQIILTIGDKKAKVFGETKVNDVAPQIVNQRTMLPARFVAENLGATVTWEEALPDVVVITKDDVEIVIYIGEDYASVNGEKVKLDSPAFIENDRTYTPVRFISEELGADVVWKEASNEVIITVK